MIKNTILFESYAREGILEIFDKEVDKEGYIVEKSDPEQRVLAIDGTEVPVKQFAGLEHGSEIFIKSDLISLIELADRIR